jgi:hypothetical protein
MKNKIQILLLLIAVVALRVEAANITINWQTYNEPSTSHNGPVLTRSSDGGVTWYQITQLPQLSGGGNNWGTHVWSYNDGATQNVKFRLSAAAAGTQPYVQSETITTSYSYSGGFSPNYITLVLNYAPTPPAPTYTTNCVYLTLGNSSQYPKTYRITFNTGVPGAPDQEQNVFVLPSQTSPFTVCTVSTNGYKPTYRVVTLDLNGSQDPSWDGVTGTNSAYIDSGIGLTATNGALADQQIYNRMTNGYNAPSSGAQLATEETLQRVGGVLHNDLAQGFNQLEKRAEVANSNGGQTVSKLETLHNDNIVTASKIDTLHTDLQTANDSLNNLVTAQNTANTKLDNIRNELIQANTNQMAQLDLSQKLLNAVESNGYWMDGMFINTSALTNSSIQLYRETTNYYATSTNILRAITNRIQALDDTIQRLTNSYFDPDPVPDFVNTNINIVSNYVNVTVTNNILVSNTFDTGIIITQQPSQLADGRQYSGEGENIWDSMQVQQSNFIIPKQAPQWNIEINTPLYNATLDLNPLSLPWVADLAALLRRIECWIICFGAAFYILTQGAAAMRNLTVARQAEGQSNLNVPVLGTFIGAISGVVVATSITIAIVAVIAFVAYRVIPFHEFILQNPFDGTVSAVVTNGIWLVDQFFPLQLLFVTTLSLFIYKVALSKAEWIANTVIRFLVKAD